MADRAIKMRREKLFRFDLNMIEVADRAWQGRRIYRATIGRHVVGWIIRRVLRKRIDRVHPWVRRTWSDRAGRQRQLDDFRLRVAGSIGREQPKPCAPGAWRDHWQSASNGWYGQIANRKSR